MCNTKLNIKLLFIYGLTLGTVHFAVELSNVINMGEKCGHFPECFYALIWVVKFRLLFIYFSI